MGVLTEVVGGGEGSTSFTNQGAHSAQVARGVLVESMASSYDSNWAEKLSKRPLDKMFESPDERIRYRAALTVKMLDNQRAFMEGMARQYGEATVQQNLGQLNQRVMDVVRIG